MPDRLIPKSLEGLYQYFETRSRACENDTLVSVDRTAMQKAVDEISKRFGSFSGMRPTRDRLKEAVSLVFTKGVSHALVTHFRYVCWALFEPWGKQGKCMLDDDQLFSELGTTLEKTCRGGMVARDWRGLLEAYFRCEIKHRNHRRLRDILNNTLPSMLQKRFVPDWLSLLNEHRNLLGETPTQGYAADVLAGRHIDIDRLRDTLGIPLDSWFWRELLLSQMQIACSRGSDQFLSMIEILIPQLDKDQYQIVREQGLALLLDHYEQKKIRGAPPVVLKESALRWWGSPHLERNTKWGFVRPETTKMVRGWLTIQAIGDFFTLLQEDGRADERRLKFWLRYQHSIDWFCFALGSLVHNSQDADYRKMREVYKGHFCGLTRPGSDRNNGFIFKIGDYTIVEFGTTGHACYCYQNDKLPFRLGGTSIDLNNLKNPLVSTCRLRHTTNTLIPWEQKFVRELSSLGIFSDTPDASASTRRRFASSPDIRTRNDAVTNRRSTEAKVSSVEDIKTRERTDAFFVVRACQRGIRFDNKRHQGGGLWFFHLDGKDDFARELEAAGFKYYGGRGWWRK